MNVYNNTTGLSAPNGACDSFVIQIVTDHIDETKFCQGLFWADGSTVSAETQPNIVRLLPVSADGTQEEVENEVFNKSPFDIDGETITLLSENIIGTYP